MADSQVLRRAKRRWWLMVVALVYVVLAPTVSIAISSYNQRQSEKAWCDVVSTLDDAYRNPDPGSPPLTARGKKIADGISRVRVQYHC